MTDSMLIKALRDPACLAQAGARDWERLIFEHEGVHVRLPLPNEPQAPVFEQHEDSEEHEAVEGQDGLEGHDDRAAHRS